MPALPLIVKILPDEIEIEADTGENLLEVIHRAGVYLEAECGGQGTCETCIAAIIEGSCTKSGITADDGLILTCQAEISDNITIKVPAASRIIPSEKKTPEIIHHIELIKPSKFSPLASAVTIKSGDLRFNDSLSDWEKIIRFLPAVDDIECGIDILRRLPAIIRKEEDITVVFTQTLSGKRIIDISPGRRDIYGIACDVGTTTVAVKIINLTTGDSLGYASSYNGQIECGADVISRIIYSQKPGRLEELQNRIIRTINRLISELLQKENISPQDVFAAVFAGNTTMTHLLLGIDPKYIRIAPYTPAVKTVPMLSAKELGLMINPNAVIHCSPAVGSYVGGDITAGLLCLSGIDAHKEAVLFIDIGTNGELVLMGDDWMIGCACSAGPAFEGVGIKCGMRAAEGAVEGVKLLDRGKEVKLQVIGGGNPLRICGSGLIELISELFQYGIIQRDGKFHKSDDNARIQKRGNENIYVLVEADESGSGREIFISEHDIDNIIRAKAAIFSACSLLLKNVGLNFKDIEKIYAAGGFGQHLDFRNAVTIGLFPDIDLEKFQYLGNTSLKGAELALLYSEYREKLAQTAKAMTYIDLSSESGYMDEYTAALFLPHTDENLFPNYNNRF